MSRRRVEAFLEKVGVQFTVKDFSAIEKGTKILKAVSPKTIISMPTAISYARMLKLLESTDDKKEKFVVTQKTLRDYFGFSRFRMPAIIANEWEIIRIADLGGFFLYLPEAISMEKLNNILEPIYREKEWGEKALYCGSYGTEKELYTAMPPIEPGWMAMTLIPNTNKKDFLVHTELLMKFVCNKLYKGRILPEDVENAVQEFKYRKEIIRQMIDSDQEDKSVEILANLMINQMFCPPGPAEEFLFSAVIRLQTGKNIFGCYRGWTRMISCSGGFFDFGNSNEFGGTFYSWIPNSSNWNLSRFYFCRFPTAPKVA